MTDEHDRFVTIAYFVTEMLGMKDRGWYYQHLTDPGLPQRHLVGGRPKLSLAECKAYMDRLKGKTPEPPAPPKRKRGRPRKNPEQAAA